MGSYVTHHGDTPGALAQRFLGDSRRWRELWPGDPTKMPTGFTIHIPQGSSGKNQVGSPAATGPSGTQAPSTAQNKAFADLPGPERAQIQAITSEFMGFLGYPQNINENMLMVLLMQQGLQNNPDQAFQYLFGQITTDLQKAAPWAQFGLDEATYMNTRGKLIAAWSDLTGVAMPDDVMHQAMAGHWSEQQLEQFARTDKGLAATQPWIAQGQSHLQVQEAYIASYGHAPQDDAVLAAWFKFSQSARQIGSSTARQTQLTQVGAPAGHPKDTEVR